MAASRLILCHFLLCCTVAAFFSACTSQNRGTVTVQPPGQALMTEGQGLIVGSIGYGSGNGEHYFPLSNCAFELEFVRLDAPGGEHIKIVSSPEAWASPKTTRVMEDEGRVLVLRAVPAGKYQLISRHVTFTNANRIVSGSAQTVGGDMSFTVVPGEAAYIGSHFATIGKWVVTGLFGAKSPMIVKFIFESEFKEDERLAKYAYPELRNIVLSDVTKSMSFSAVSVPINIGGSN